MPEEKERSLEDVAARSVVPEHIRKQLLEEREPNPHRTSVWDEPLVRSFKRWPLGVETPNREQFG